VKDDAPSAPVSAELLWSLIEHKAETDEAFRLHLLSYVVLQCQSTTAAGRLLDLLGVPRGHKHPEPINPLSMLYQVGVGTLETTATAEDLARVRQLLAGVLDLVLAHDAPALLDALRQAAAESPEAPPPTTTATPTSET